MEIAITRLIESVFFPPGIYFFLLIIGGWLSIKRSRHLPWLLGSLIGIFYVTSAQVFPKSILSSLEDVPPLSQASLANPQAQAIVVLSSGYYHPAPEYLNTTVDDSNLVRLRYGAFLNRQTGLPVLVSGGRPTSVDRTLAEVMAEVLRDEFNVQDVWLEEQSRTTWENAEFSRTSLAEKHIDTIYLVTHAWHIPRAQAAFEKVGFKVIAAPTKFSSDDDHTWYDYWVPSDKGIRASRIVLHELIGRVWYAIRH